MPEISRKATVQAIKTQYRNIVGAEPRPKQPQETYNSYKNVLIQEMLQRPNVSLVAGERISKNKPTDRTGAKVGRPRTTGRQRVCEIVAKGKNTNKLAEQNYECKRSAANAPPATPRRPQTPASPIIYSPEMKQAQTPRRVEEKKQEAEIEEFIDISQLENKGIDILRRIVTALVPVAQRNKNILIDRYRVNKGVLTELSVRQMIDLLRNTGITRISSADAIKVLLK